MGDRLAFLEWEALPDASYLFQPKKRAQEAKRGYYEFISQGQMGLQSKGKEQTLYLNPSRCDRSLTGSFKNVQFSLGMRPTVIII